ncbi:MAG: MFS transporter [Halanaerobiales bacterium]|nr:MFS transporter [Halanaerobiales bacterium]
MIQENNNQNQFKKNSFSYFLIIWVGELLSTIGSGLTAFALGVYAFQMTGQATSATLVILFAFLPALLLRPIGGVLADRIDRRFLMIIGNVGSAFGIVLVFVLMSMKPESLWVIYPGVILSSVFFAFQNPAYKASVSDFLPKELYAKASGLVQLAGSAQFLIAPLLAGILMSIIDIRYILIIDIMSFLLSAVAILFVRSKMKIKVKTKKKTESRFFEEMADGFKTVVADRGILILISVTSLILFYVGLLQALFGPMVLSFTDARTFGTAQSICAIGMLISSLIISTLGGKKNHVLILSVSLALMGIFFSFIGMNANIWYVIIPGFLFFFTVPFVNSSIDVMIRQNISNEKQGRAWSLISVITYIGSIIAYAVSGFLADKIFNPLFMPGGALASSFGRIFGVGEGRGIAFIFFVSGIFVVIIAGIIYRLKSIQQLDLNLDSEPLSFDDLVSDEI